MMSEEHEDVDDLVTYLFSLKQVYASLLLIIFTLVCVISCDRHLQEQEAYHINLFSRDLKEKYLGKQLCFSNNKRTRDQENK